MVLEFHEGGAFLEMPAKHIVQLNVYNVHVNCSYRSAGVFARLSAITYDRLWPQLELHVLQYKSWGRGNYSVPPLPHTPQ